MKNPIIKPQAKSVEKYQMSPSLNEDHFKPLQDTQYLLN